MPEELVIKQAPPESFWERLSGLIREDPKKLKAKAQNALAYSEMLGISPGEAYKYHDAISARIFGEKLTTPKLMGGLMTLPVAASLGTNPLGSVIGLAALQAVSEVESAVISLVKDEKYKVFRNKGLADLLPEDTSELTTSVVDTFDMMGKLLVGGAAFKGFPKLGTRIARQIIETHKLPRELFIDGTKLKQELQTGNILPQEELQIYKDLGLSGPEVKQAIKRGLKIKVPSEKVITITDRPWFAKVKKLLRISPYEETRVIRKGKPTYELGPESEVPETFASTEEAEAFGRKATDEQVKVLAEKYLESQRKQEELKKAGDFDQVMSEAVRGQLFREAIEAKIGKGRVNQEGKTVEEVLGEKKAPELKQPPRELEEPEWFGRRVYSGHPSKHGEWDEEIGTYYGTGGYYASESPEHASTFATRGGWGTKRLNIDWDAALPDKAKQPFLTRPPSEIRKLFGIEKDKWSDEEWKNFIEKKDVSLRDIWRFLRDKKLSPFIDKRFVGKTVWDKILNNIYYFGHPTLGDLPQIKEIKEALPRSKEGPHVIPLRVAAKNPLFTENTPKFIEQLKELKEKVSLDLKKAAQSKDKSALEEASRKKVALGSIISYVENNPNSWYYNLAEGMPGYQVRDALLELGYDAVTHPKAPTGFKKAGTDYRIWIGLKPGVLVEEAKFFPQKGVEKQEEVSREEFLPQKEEERQVEVLPSYDPKEIQQEALKEIKNVKTRIRLITGQRKIVDLVREDVALRAALKKAAREARHAFSVGKKEGYEKAKKHYLELREKYKQRVAQRAYINNLVKKITQPIGNSVDYAYKEAIELLREGIDPHFRSKKKLRALERTRDFFERNPDKLDELSAKKLKEISKKPLNEYTIEDLEKIATEIEKLKKLGRTKRRLKLAQRERIYEKKKEDILTSIGSLREGEIKPPEVLIDLREKKPNIIQRYRASSLRPSRIFDMLDGGKNFSGPVHRIFYDEVNRGIDVSYRWIDRRKKAVKSKMKSLGLTPRDLAKTREIDGVKYSVDRLLDVYAGWKNPRKRLALMYGNNVTPEFVEKVENVLTNEEKKFADYIIREYEKNYPRLREAYIEYANDDMGYEPFYTPIRRADILPRSFKSELADELLIRNGLKKAYVPRSFTYKRKDIPAEFQRPLTLGLYATWLDQVPKQERFIALGQKIKELQRLVSDKDIREAIREKAGQHYLEQVEHYVNRIVNPNFYKALTPIERISQTLRRNTVVAYLAFNLLTMAKQLPSVLLYLPEAGPYHLFQAMIKMVKNPRKWYRFVRSRDPQIRFRKIEREMEELKTARDVMAKVGRFGMRGIQLFDSIAVTTGWLAVYDRYVGELGEMEAIRRAQNATHRTQPAASPKDLPSMYASNEVLNWVLQFTNQLNQIYNIATYDIPSQIKNKEFDKAFLSTIALAMVALSIWSISNKRLPKDKDDLKEALTDQALNSIPIVGREILSASKGWEPQGIPALNALRSIGSLATDTSPEKKVDRILEGVSVLTGLPYVGAKRVAKAIEKESPAELLGPKKEKRSKKRRRYE